MCTLGTGHYFKVLFFNECSCLFGGENEPNHSVECTHITEVASSTVPWKESDRHSFESQLLPLTELLGQLINFSELQFLSLQKGTNIYIIGLL